VKRRTATQTDCCCNCWFYLLMAVNIKMAGIPNASE